MRSSLFYFIVFVSTTVGAAPRAQQVTFDDLQGATIESTVTQLRTVKSERGTGPQRFVILRRVTIGPADQIKHSLTLTVTLLRIGDTDKKTWSSTSALGRPFSFRDGQAVWVFEDGKLTLLRTQTQGAALAKYSFARIPQGITCKHEFVYAREDGVGSLESTSTTHGAKRVVVLNAKEVGNTCRVVKSQGGSGDGK